MPSFEEQYRFALKRNPTEARNLATQQRDQIATKLKDNRGFVGDILSRWKRFDEDLVQLDQWIRNGDQAAQNGQPEAEQVRWYAHALVEGQRFAQDLDNEVGEGSTAILLIRDIVDVTETGAREAGSIIATNAGEAKEKLGDLWDGAGEQLKKTGSSLNTAILVVAGAVGLGLAATLLLRFGRTSSRDEDEELLDF